MQVQLPQQALLPLGLQVALLYSLLPDLQLLLALPRRVLALLSSSIRRKTISSVAIRHSSIRGRDTIHRRLLTRLELSVNTALIAMIPTQESRPRPRACQFQIFSLDARIFAGVGIGVGECCIPILISDLNVSLIFLPSTSQTFLPPLSSFPPSFLPSFRQRGA